LKTISNPPLVLARAPENFCKVRHRLGPHNKSQLGKGGIHTWWKSISKVPQYVTADGEDYWEKVKMCRFSSENWFFCTKFVKLAMAGKRRTVVHILKRSVINWP